MDNFDKIILKNIVKLFYYLKQYGVGKEIYWFCRFLVIYSNNNLLLFLILLVGSQGVGDQLGRFFVICGKGWGYICGNYYLLVGLGLIF